jgi:hypothetical protein
MDYDEYFTAWLVKERLSQMRAAAQRDALLRRLPPRRSALRVALGTVLIRLGAWLCSEGACVTAPSEIHAPRGPHGPLGTTP